MHSLLKRQLKRHLGDQSRIPEEWRAFVNGVNEAYRGFDTDRTMLENSLELSSQELLDANSEMRAVFQAIPDLVFRIDHQSIILDIKGGAAGELMIGPEDVIGKPIRDSLLKDVAPLFSGAIQRVIANNTSVSIEYSAVVQSQESYYEARLVPLLEKQIVVIIRDITERKQSLRLLGAAVEQSTESIIITDTDLDLPGPRILFVNPAFTKMTGYTAAEALGQTPRILQGPKSDRSVLRRLRETLARGETFSGETVNYRKDRTEFNVEWQVAPIRNSRGNITHFLGIQRDITKRKQAELALQQSESQFHTLAKVSPVGIFRASPNGHCNYWNEKLCRMTGMTADEALGAGWANGIHPDDRPRVFAEWSRCAAEQLPFKMQYRFIHKDGSVTWTIGEAEAILDTDGQLTGYVGSITDVTELKEAEDALRESRSRLEFALESAEIGDWDLDLINDTSQRSLRHDQIFGYKEPIRHWGYARLMQHVHPDDRDELNREFTDAMAKLRDLKFECRIIWADRSIHWIEVHGRIYGTRAGKATRVLGTIRDVTQRKDAENAVRESEERFRFLNNLTEATHTLADPEQIMAVMSRMLGEHLWVSRCAYADVEEDGKRFTIVHDYTDGCASTAGNYDLSLFGSRAVAKLHRGETLIIRNVGTELLPSQGADMFNAIGIKAIISCPLLKGGRLRALMAVHQTIPRDWTPADVAIVQEVVERCWATIERRTAEEKLRRSEALLRIAGRAGQLGGWADDLAGNITWSDEIYAIHELPTGKAPELDEALSFYPPSARQSVTKAFNACVKNGTPYDLELEFTSAKGRKGWVRLIGEAQRNAAGKITRVQGAFQNITERKLAEANLAEASGLLDAMLENSLDRIYFKDRKSRLVRFSKSFLECFGLTDPALLRGKTDADLYTPEHAAPALADEEEIMRTGRPLVGKLEKETYPDGNVTWALTTKMPWRDGTGAIVGTFGFSVDATARKEAEDKLVYERDQWRALLDSSPDTIYFKDLQSRFVVASRSKVSKTVKDLPNIRELRAARGLRADVPELELLTGLSDVDLNDNEDSRTFYADEQNVIKTGEPMVGRVIKQTARDGTVSWWWANKMPWRDRNGKIIGTFGISKNITAIKEAEAKLALEQERFQFVFESMPVGAALARHYPDGRVDRIINDAHLRICGLTREQDQIPGIYKQITPPEDHARQVELYRDLDAGGSGCLSMEKRYNRLSDGKTVWVMFFLQRQQNADDSYDRLTMVVDITERKRAEEKLAETSGLLDAMLANSPDLIYFKDLQSRFVRFTNACYRGFGLSDPAMLVGKTDADFYGTNQELLPYIDEQNIIRTGKPVIDKLEKIDHTDGSVAWLLTTKMPWRDGTGAIVGTFGISKDVTARKEAEDKLAYERDQWRALLDSAPDAIYFKDLESRFVVVSRSKLTEVLTGVPDLPARRLALGQPIDVPEAELLTGLTDFDTYGDEDARGAYADEQEIIRTGEAMIGKIEMQKFLNGTVHWSLTSKMPWRDPKGKIIGTFGISKDITDLKKAEELLRRSEERSHSIIASAHDAFVCIDARGCIVDWNLRAEKMFGWPSFEALGRSLEETIIPQNDRENHVSDLRRLLTTGEGPVLNTTIELTALRRNGEEFPVEMTIWALKLGDTTTYNAFLRDITRRKQAEAKLEKAHKDLIEASRHAGMAEIATNVLHNVGNVLNSVNVSATLLTERTRFSKGNNVGKVSALLREHENDLAAFLTDDPKGKKIPTFLAALSEQMALEQTATLEELDSLRKNIDHIMEIVAKQQQFATVARSSEAVPLVDLVEEVLRLDGNTLNNGFKLVRDYQSHPTVRIERHKVMQILINLMRNAKNACAESGRTDQQMTVRITSDQHHCRIAIADNGVGIAKENLTLIFNHGFTTRTHGTGFGLHSDALTAKEIGGSLKVESDGPGLGATFTLVLSHASENN